MSSAASSSTGLIFSRPQFPSGWSHVPLSLDDLCLANVLPVGQSFLWHRQQLSPAIVPDLIDVKAESDVKPSLEYSATGILKSGKGERDGRDDITEEFSRVIADPPRVILLRQSPRSGIYYTSVALTDTATIGAVPSVMSSISAAHCPDPTADMAYRRQEIDLRWIRDYFNLDRVPNLPGLYASWIDRDPLLFGKTLGAEEADRILAMHRGDRSHSPASGSQRGRGIRVLQQDPWECLVAFITSTNNHIPRIAGLMHRLSTHFSPPLLSLPTLGVPPPPPRDPNADIAEDPQGVDSALHDPTPLTTYHSFPSASSLAEAGAEATLEPVLRELGFGYRAGFIASSLATVRDRFGAGEGEVERGLMGLRCAEGEGDKVVDEVREVLIGLKGVGRKVADCVMLMCLGQDAIIPIDTHVAAIAARHPSFPSRLKNKPMSAVLYNEVQQFLMERWGEMGGWAQAVMFALDLKESTAEKGAKGAGAGSGSVSGTPKKGVRKETPSSAIGDGAGTPMRVKSEMGALEDGVITPSKVDGGAGGATPPKLQRRQTGEKRKASKQDSTDDRVGADELAGDQTAALPPVFKRTRSSARLMAQGIPRDESS